MRIYGIGFEDEGVSVGYSLEEDVKDGGRMSLTRTMNVANSGENAESIAELKEILIDFVQDMIERFNAASIFSPDDDDEEDEDDYMGSASDKNR